MYPNKDGWISVETVNERGERVTVFHGIVEVSSAETQRKWQQSMLDAVRAYRFQQTTSIDPSPPLKLVPLFDGKVWVSQPEGTA
mmetsp:Transcript_134469/g.287701  ORF Transcript_134469/g.287701 Transcript_134469/m.287701 type:complete len:84 (-) Transcript_134469:35-286(-)